MFKKIMLFALICLVFSSLTFGEELPQLDTKTRTVAVFKNGLGFFIREGKTDLKDGWASTEEVPKATLGTFWIGTLEGGNLEEAIAYKKEVEKETEAITLNELLKVNVGKKVILTALNDEKIEGIIKAIPEDRAMKIQQSNYGFPSPSQMIQSAFIILETKEGDVAFNWNQIKKIQFLENYSTKTKVKEMVKGIKFKVGGKSSAKLSLSYLQKGISWMPSYQVSIQDDDKARITMKSNLINEVEDLEDTEIFFVVGYPNFKFSDALSPMTLEQNLSQLISTLQRGGRADNFAPMSNIMRQSVSFAAEMDLDQSYSSIESMSGVSEEDLFFYNKKGVNLKKGEIAYYHIFSEEVDCNHIYEWNVSNTTDVDGRGYQRSQNQDDSQAQVWHSVKLTNSTNQPWTTAPAFAVRGDKPIAQDVLSYTPKGATTNLKLTVATDLKVNKHEQETERERDIKMYRYSYDLVTVEGKLYAKNHKSEKVDTEITKSLTGEVIEASHKGKVKKIAEGIQFKGVNTESLIEWKFSLDAGEEIELTYTYKVYVAH